jgi:hypothetical protein
MARISVKGILTHTAEFAKHHRQRAANEGESINSNLD